jgi:RNA polymerase sigma-70 factor, ECF subfamily
MKTSKGGAVLEASHSIKLSAEVPDIEAIMNLYGEDILHIIYCYVKDKTLAEDLAQEVFLTVYLKLASFKQDSSLKTWITRIAINKCKDHFRTSYFKKTWLSSVMHGFLKDTKPSAEEDCMQKDSGEGLLQAVVSLPVKYRESIILYYYQEFSVKEISSLLSVNEATVKSRLKRGRERLKTLIEVEEIFCDG